MSLKFLPDASFRQLQGGSGRIAASSINSLANDPRDLTATVAARGALLPILYGRRDIPGLIFAVGAIGTDLVVGVLWCIGEIDAIENVYINDEAPPVGVTITSYLGTSAQTVDATLSSAVAAYNDTMRIQTPDGPRGVAYTVARIPVDAIDGWPRFRATVRGLKVYDPRVPSTAYSDNSALCLADFIADRDFGLGLDVAGVADAADWADSLLGGSVARCKIGLYIAFGAPAPSYVDMLAEYAECFWIREGAGIRLIPDAPVDLETVPTLAPADIIEGSLRLTAESSLDTPTEVEIQYSEPSSPATEPWGFESATSSLPGVDSGEVSRVPTSVMLEGVTRNAEAANKALARLNRMQNRIRAEWQTLDAAVVHQTGDVIVIEHAARGVSLPVRIESVDLVGPGRYRVGATRYDASHYPSELILPGDTGLVPVGAIGVLSGSTVPDGWEDYSAADGKYLVGAGGDLAIGATGGSDTAALAGTTSSAGGHFGGDDFYIRAGVGGGNFNVGRSSSWTDADRGAHSHSIDTTVTPNPLRRNLRLVRKTGTDGLELPAAVHVFGVGGILVSGISRVTTYAGRLVVAAASESNAGSASQSASIATESADDSHHHGFEPVTFSNSSSHGSVVTNYQPESGGGSHTHTSTASITPAVKRRRVAMYGSGGDYPVVPGMIMGWAGAIGSLPTDWVLCDGANATPDLRDRFVEIASEGSEDQSAGDNTVTVSGTTNNVSHSHQGAGTIENETRKLWPHSATQSHNHTFSITTGWTPPYYALAFIMFAPAG